MPSGGGSAIPLLIWLFESIEEQARVHDEVSANYHDVTFADARDVQDEYLDFWYASNWSGWAYAACADYFIKQFTADLTGCAAGRMVATK